MIVRILGGNESYVMGQPLPTMGSSDGIKVPLLVDQIDVSSIMLPTIMREMVTVTKNGRDYVGHFISMDGSSITIMDDQHRTLTIGGYDMVARDRLLRLPIRHDGNIVMSYVSYVISGSIEYVLDTGTGTLSMYLSMANGGIVDIDDATVDIMLGSEPMIMRAMAEVSPSSIGMYRVPGLHSVKAGHRTFSMVDSITVSPTYTHVIDVTNGTSISTYMASWMSPRTMPGGPITFMVDGSPIARGRINDMVDGSMVVVPIVRTPLIYAVSTIQDEDGHISISGTVYNMSDEDELVTLRYWVGDRPVGESTEGYVTLRVNVGARGSSPYSYESMG